MRAERCSLSASVIGIPERPASAGLFFRVRNLVESAILVPQSDQSPLVTQYQHVGLSKGNEIATVIFSLSRLVQEYINSTTETDPKILAEEVLDQIPDDYLEDVLLDLLPQYISQSFRVQRASIEATVRQEEEEGPKLAQRDPGFKRGSNDIKMIRIASKVAGSYRLGEAPEDFLRIVADECQQRIDDDTHYKNQLITVADAMSAAGVETAGELGDKKLTSLWNKA